MYAILIPFVVQQKVTQHCKAVIPQFKKSIAFVGKVMSLLFNMLSRFVIAFLPRSKHLLISWLQPPSAVVWEPKKRKSVTASTFPLPSAIK